MAGQKKLDSQAIEIPIPAPGTPHAAPRGVSLWMLIGPSLIILTVLVGLVKADPSLIWMPAVAVIGLAVTWQWRMSGLFAILGILAASILITYSNIPIADRFWHVGMAIAVAIGMVVTTLCSEEVDALFSSVYVESKSRLEALWRLDEKSKEGRNSWAREREEVTTQLRVAIQESSDKDRRLLGYEQVMGLVRKDLDISQRRQNELLDEVFQLQQEVNQLKASAGEAVPIRIASSDRLDELNEARTRLFQAHLDYEALEERSDFLRAQARETRKYEGLYAQLREQFEEKKNALAAAQAELLTLYEHVAKLEEAEASGSSIPLAQVEKMLEKQMSQPEVPKDEVKALEELVANLMNQIAVLTQQVAAQAT